jgi:hypothetical protein
MNDSDCLQLLRKLQFKLKPFEDRDIDVAIEACGVYVTCERQGDKVLEYNLAN